MFLQKNVSDDYVPTMKDMIFAQDPRVVTPNSFVRQPADPCYFDEELGVTVHRFDTGAYICHCGKDNVQEKIDAMKEKQNGTPWRRGKRAN